MRHITPEDKTQDDHRTNGCETKECRADCPHLFQYVSIHLLVCGFFIETYIFSHFPLQSNRIGKIHANREIVIGSTAIHSSFGFGESEYDRCVRMQHQHRRLCHVHRCVKTRYKAAECQFVIHHTSTRFEFWTLCSMWIRCDCFDVSNYSNT